MARNSKTCGIAFRPRREQFYNNLRVPNYSLVSANHPSNYQCSIRTTGSRSTASALIPYRPVPYIHTRLIDSAMSNACPEAPSSDRLRKLWGGMTSIESTHGPHGTKPRLFYRILWNVGTCVSSLTSLYALPTTLGCVGTERSLIGSSKCRSNQLASWSRGTSVTSLSLNHGGFTHSCWPAGSCGWSLDRLADVVHAEHHLEARRSTTCRSDSVLRAR